MTTLADYLGSKQAREDVGEVIRDARQGSFSQAVCGFWMHCATSGAWQTIALEIRQTRESVTAYYRPNGDRFVVTDLGEGFRVACLRGFDRCEWEHMQRLAKLAQTFPSAFDEEAPLGWIELRDITAADLPDAICRVMLASLKVSEMRP